MPGALSGMLQWWVALCCLNVATAWAEGRLVRIAAVEYSPYIGSALPHDGYAHEVLVEAFRRTGH